MADDPVPDPPPEHDPPEPRRSPINPFEAALRRRTAPEIRVSWSLKDMQMLRPDWTSIQCELFLRRHTAKFAAGMIRMGLALLAEMAADPHFTSGTNNGDGKTQPPSPSPPNN